MFKFLEEPTILVNRVRVLNNNFYMRYKLVRQPTREYTFTTETVALIVYNTDFECCTEKVIHCDTHTFRTYNDTTNEEEILRALEQYKASKKRDNTANRIANFSVE